MYSGTDGRVSEQPGIYPPPHRADTQTLAPKHGDTTWAGLEMGHLVGFGDSVVKDVDFEKEEG